MENLISHNELNDKRILITGGAGFIGGNLINKLLNETNCIIFNLDKISYCSDLTLINKNISKENSFFEKRYFFIKKDLRDKFGLSNIFKDVKPDIVFHLAAETHVDRSLDSPGEFIQNNVISTLNLLESSLEYLNLMNKNKQSNFRFIHLSTDEVFGSIQVNHFFKEDFKYFPSNPYSASKASCDHLVYAWNKSYGLQTIIVNCSNNYGPGQYPEKLIPLAFLKGLKGQEIPLYGNGCNFRDWLFVDDHINALIKIALNGIVGETYLVGNQTQISNKDVVVKICRFLDEKCTKEYSHEKLIKKVEDRPGHDFGYSINPEKLKKDLNWSPKMKFDEGLKYTLSWYLENLSWCNKVLKRSKYDGKRLGLSRN